MSQIHDRDPVGNVAHDQKVMGDKEIGQTEFVLQLVEHVDDLRLDRDVEGRYRLIADNEVRIDSQGSGNTDTLALSAGELMGVARRMFGVEADMVHELQDSLPSLLFCLV